MIIKDSRRYPDTNIRVKKHLDDVIHSDDTGITINLGFYGHRLVNRSRNQTDGECSAEEFCNKYCQDVVDILKSSDGANEVLLDLTGVEKLSPAWANEFLGFFASKFPCWDMAEFYRHFSFEGASMVKFRVFWIEAKCVFAHI